MLGVEPATSGFWGSAELYQKTNLSSKSEEFVLNKACPIICSLVVGSEFG